jgi:hypothetical protein
MGVARALLLTPTGVGTRWAGSASCWYLACCHGGCARPANVRIVMGWSVERESSREVAARVERDRGSLYICVKTPARSVLH